jgi:hypothetical protein
MRTPARQAGRLTWLAGAATATTSPGLTGGGQIKFMPVKLLLPPPALKTRHICPGRSLALFPLDSREERVVK